MSKQLLNDNSYYLTVCHLVRQHGNLQNHGAGMNLPFLCETHLSGYTPGSAQAV